MRTPSGASVTVDERGRVLSFSLQGRQRRAWARSGLALAGRSLLHPWSERLAEEEALLAPVYLPSPSSQPEVRWGLVPGFGQLPIGSLGEPLLPSLRRLAPLQSDTLAPWRSPSDLFR